MALQRNLGQASRPAEINGRLGVSAAINSCSDPVTRATCWFLALSSLRKVPPLHFDPPYRLPMPTIIRSLALSAVSAGLLDPRFSQFSKSRILTIWVTSGFRIFTVTVVSPKPGVPAGVFAVTSLRLGRFGQDPIVLTATPVANVLPNLTERELALTLYTPVHRIRMRSPPCGDPTLSMIRTM